MAVFRVEKNKNYTIMSNHHLRDTSLSLKAKGLLSLMLSLPENWDYTTKGLAKICKDGIDSICATIKELEGHGYVIRERIRNEKGQLTITEYTILEEPQPKRENPVLDNPILGKPEQENPRQLNTKELITDLSNKDQSIYPSDSESTVPDENTMIDKMDVYSEILKENIEYDTLILRGYDKELLNEIFSLLLDTVCSSKKQIRIGGEDICAELVKSRFLKLNQFHIEYVYDCLKKNDTKVFNIRSYLLTALYNAPNTMNHYYLAEVKNDICKGVST